MKPAILAAAAATALLGGCSGGEQPKPTESKAAALQPGEYEVAIKVDSIRSTDDSTPAIAAKAGDTQETQRVCIPDGGAIDPKVFTAAGDTCTEQNSYVRGGRMSIQYQCTRPAKGPVTEMVSGKFKTDSFEAEAKTATYFSGTGDYELVRTVTGRRVGDCSPTPAAEG